MKLPKNLTVSIACLRLPLPQFQMCGRSIVSAMTDNENYLDPFPSLPTVITSLDDLETKAAAAYYGGRLAIAVRNGAWQTARTQLRSLASYVQAHCQNNLLVLYSSGFTARKGRSPIGSLRTPQNVRTSYTGRSGQLKLRCKPVRGARAGYIVQMASSPDGPYTTVCTSSSSRILISNLTPTQTYWFRVNATGTAGPSGWSNVVKVIAI